MIVSTAVPDVVSNFGSVVKVARSREEFVRLCVAAIEQPDPKAADRGLKMASENTWDFIVSQLENHLAEALAKASTRVKV
jgi:hypothetical protein